jgi:hypothetical protein
MTNGAIPSSYPTTSDISMFMQELGYKWSNDAQIYYNQNGARYTHMSRDGADRLYKYLIGDKPYTPLK